MEKRTINFSPPDISELEIAEVAEALRSGWITTGPRTKLLERRLAAYIETGNNNVDYKTGLINVCRSTISSDSYDVSIQSAGNVSYSSNVSINSKKFYDINKPTHIKMDDSIKCK